MKTMRLPRRRHVRLSLRLVVIAALVIACTPNPSPAPTGTTPSTAAPTATPAGPTPALTPEPSPSTGPSLPPTSWEQVFALERGSLSDLIAWRDVLIATGCMSESGDECGQRIIVTSSDGVTWDVINVDVAGMPGFASVHRVGKRLFALGYANTRRFGGAVVHTSTDGRTWSRVRSPSFEGRAIDDIIRSPLGTFAIGYNAPPSSDNTSGFLMWPVEADGSFGPVRVVDTDGAIAIITNADWMGDEFLAWGPRLHPMSGLGPTVVLASTDGRQWTERAVISGGRHTYVSTIGAVDHGLVAVGYQGRRFPLTPRAWTSEDAGRTWAPADVEGDDARIALVDVEDVRLIARGSRFWGPDELPVSWASTDGSVWALLPDDEDLPMVAGLRAMMPATIGDRTCVAGRFYSDLPLEAAIYCH